MSFSLSRIDPQHPLEVDHRNGDVTNNAFDNLELDDQPQVSAEDAIRTAREKAAGDRRASRAMTLVAAPPLGRL